MYLLNVPKLRQSGKCPGCALHNPLGLEACRHCGRVFTIDDEYEMLSYIKDQKEKGVRFAIFYAVAFVLFLFLYSQFS